MPYQNMQPIVVSSHSCRRPTTKPKNLGQWRKLELIIECNFAALPTSWELQQVVNDGPSYPKQPHLEPKQASWLCTVTGHTPRKVDHYRLDTLLDQTMAKAPKPPNHQA